MKTHFQNSLVIGWPITLLLLALFVVMGAVSFRLRQTWAISSSICCILSCIDNRKQADKQWGRSFQAMHILPKPSLTLHVPSTRAFFLFHSTPRLCQAPQLTTDAVCLQVKDAHALVATGQPNQLKRLQQSNQLLEEIQKGLNDYLEKKRLYFARWAHQEKLSNSSGMKQTMFVMHWRKTRELLHRSFSSYNSEKRTFVVFECSMTLDLVCCDKEVLKEERW